MCTGKMARVLVEVEKPLGKSAEPPLLLGSFATVRIRGAGLDKLASIPRTALHNNDRVWVMSTDNKLEIRHVEVVWSETDRVYVTGELSPGERTVVSRIAVPVEGMDLRLNGNHDVEAHAAVPSSAESMAEEDAEESADDNEETPL